MPKKPMDYSKACIYKIACKDPNITDVYVGSTTNLSKRRYLHNSVCNNCDSKDYNLIVYKFIREHGNFDNWEVVKLEDYPCESYEELTRRERHWFEQLCATLNKQVPSRTDREYKQDNRNKLQEYDRQYRKKNRETINEKHNKQIDCECGGHYAVKNKTRHFKTKKHQNYLKTLE